jgi:hypothetical protein
MKSPAADPLRSPPARIDRGISLGDASFPRSGSLEFPPARRRTGSQRLSGALDAEVLSSLWAMDSLTTSYFPTSKLHDTNSELIGVIDKIHPLKDEVRAPSRQIRGNRYLGADRLHHIFMPEIVFMNHCLEFYRADESRLKSNIALLARFHSYLEKFPSVNTYVDVGSVVVTL